MLRSLLLFLSLLLLAACGSAESDTQSEQQADQQAVSGDVVTIGASVYEANCASCHGVNLEGEADWKTPNEDGSWKAPPHDDDGHTWHHPDEYILERIMNGTAGLDAKMQELSNMPAYGEQLSDAEVDAVLQFIKSRWSSEIQEMHSQRN